MMDFKDRSRWTLVEPWDFTLLDVARNARIMMVYGLPADIVRDMDAAREIIPPQFIKLPHELPSTLWFELDRAIASGYASGQEAIDLCQRLRAFRGIPAQLPSGTVLSVRRKTFSPTSFGKLEAVSFRLDDLPRDHRRDMLGLTFFAPTPDHENMRAVKLKRKAADR